MKKTVYLDNAATSWPKPPGMMEAMVKYNRFIGASPGRSGHTRSVDAGRVLIDARQAVAKLFGVPDVLRVIFTKNATEALNIVISGLLGEGGHAVVTGMEHNSVMRPLNAARSSGADFSVAPCSGGGELDPGDVVPLIRPDTRLIVITHASNVTGTIMPIAEIAAIARERGIPLCVDAAQTAGAVPIDIEAMHIDLLAFTGHKSLYGPQGTGGLVIGGGLEHAIGPLIHGGTGSRSEFEVQPDFLPDKYESGTPNTIGIAGLHAGIGFVSGVGIDAVRRHEKSLTARLLERLESIDGVRVYGVKDPDRQTAVVSFAVDGMSPSDVSFALDEEYGVMSRPGLHCAPSAHRAIGTFPEGTVRFSAGFFTTREDIDYAADAVAAIAARGRKGAGK
ncbi:MAG TPA: aminotransferase class V-fold PLP-dependent enzyme [Deltaproteobacteria bacterium]|nr:aminotransferase class V-fold PLP-dependent enzyme [Deltaproteobacteria bacterium]HRR22397.1 aminotransferase class V-fold PLP-dependent enzyme [Desulfomonilia bacterium]HOE71844.1 aminotransferase class V-fold PLP-dependent enzyme [Deltaproteobacteria bacterium]HOS26841.1 aminotransferase class V-fold PLP-dependent enzyme [Deltaproteobacteria bacterium]HPA85171.1 aminotransferase class V-fold PLP-dependent enzyme [Deltaproteobacteria bacterium]